MQAATLTRVLQSAIHRVGTETLSMNKVQPIAFLPKFRLGKDIANVDCQSCSPAANVDLDLLIHFPYI